MDHDLSRMIDRDFCRRTILALIHGHQVRARGLAARSLGPVQEGRPRMKRLPEEFLLPAAVGLVVPTAAAGILEALWPLLL